MKNRFLSLLEDIGYPYQRLNALQKQETRTIHKEVFKRNEMFYRDKHCASCYISLLNDLAIRFQLPKVGELTTDYKERMSICSSCSATKGQNGKVLTCGKLGKQTYGKNATCGCILNIKARLKSMHCPRKKW